MGPRRRRTDELLLHVRRPAGYGRAESEGIQAGLDISATSVGNNFCVPQGDDRAKQIEFVKRWVDHSVELGTPCVRVFAGHTRAGSEHKSDFAAVTECLKNCCDYAGKRGVLLALENHGYLTETAPDVLAILDAVNHEWLGLSARFHKYANAFD